MRGKDSNGKGAQLFKVLFHLSHAGDCWWWLHTWSVMLLVTHGTPNAIAGGLTELMGEQIGIDDEVYSTFVIERLDQNRFERRCTRPDRPGICSWKRTESSCNIYVYFAWEKWLQQPNLVPWSIRSFYFQWKTDGYGNDCGRCQPWYIFCVHVDFNRESGQSCEYEGGPQIPQAINKIEEWKVFKW